MHDAVVHLAEARARHERQAAAADRSLATEGLTYAIDGRGLVNDVTLSVDGGTFTVVMGPNGAGKSILLRLLHGLLRPTAGEVRWGGGALDEARRRQQAMVFQKPVLLRRSVAANLDYVLRERGKARQEMREALLARVGLEGFSAQPARLLSGGEQQRLALARALAVKPRILFMDEPTASLDPASVAVIEAIVREAHREGTKVIFVTHDIGQARRLADDVVFLHRGRVMEHARAEEFFSNPASDAAKAFLDGQIVI